MGMMHRRQLTVPSIIPQYTLPVPCPMLPFYRHTLPRVPRFDYRSLASVADAVALAPYQIFDRYAKVLQKDRSAVPSRVKNSRTVDYVRDEIAGRLMERMLVSISFRLFLVHLNTPCVGHQAQVQYRVGSGVRPRSLREIAGD